MKIGLGLTMTMVMLFLTLNMSKKGYSFKTRARNSLSLFFYLAYLFLGAISIFWAFDYQFAMIQLFRDFDLLVFSCDFILVDGNCPLFDLIISELDFCFHILTRVQLHS